MTQLSLESRPSDSRSMAFSIAPGSFLSISKGRPTLYSPPKQREMGGKAWLTAVTWCDYSTDCYRHLLLCVSTSVAAWVTLSKSLTPAVSCFFSLTEQSLMWRWKDVMTRKVVEKKKRNSWFLNLVWATQSNLKQDYPIHKLPKP